MTASEEATMFLLLTMILLVIELKIKNKNSYSSKTRSIYDLIDQGMNSSNTF